MTGFGRGEAIARDAHVTVELRTVNHRFVDVQPRLPQAYSALEPELQRLLKETIRRGRVELTVRRQPTRGGSVVLPDVPLFRAYLAAIHQLTGDRTDAERAAAMSHALAQPGVLSVVAAETDVEDETPWVLAALTDALAALQRMRTFEGRELTADLSRQVDLLEGHLDAVDAVAGDLVVRLQERLVARLGKLLADQVEPWRLAQEAALAADKADVSEEIARLRSHVLQLRDALASDDAVGRRLDFLLQEVGREINTLGSKAVDHPVSARVVEMKTVLERMREQAANVE